MADKCVHGNALMICGCGQPSMRTSEPITETYEVPRATYNERMYGAPGSAGQERRYEQDKRWEQLEILENVTPLDVLKQQIEQATRLRPTAIMLPLSWHPDVTTMLGIEIIRGDRYALLYEPPR